MRSRNLSLAGTLLFSLAGWSCTSQLTYYEDVQPIVQAKCEGCHNPNGIGPFSLQTADEVVAQKALIPAAVSNKVMPPWPPSDSCNSYALDRSLSDAQIKTITDWFAQGAAIGDPKNQKTAAPTDGMTRIDFSLQMPQPFTPLLSPDDYRCFLLDWPETAPEYVTGFGVLPGDAQIVHHAIAYIAAPSEVATYQALVATDGHPGWTCFGGPDGTSTPNSGSGGFGGGRTQWLGGWAPGAPGNDFPAGTGVLVQPGSKIILQIHYNTSATPPAPDQTTIHIEVESSVTKPAYVMPFLDPAWIIGDMLIPAGSADTMYNYAIDTTPYMAKLTQNLIPNGVPFTVYMSFLHMHTRGSSIVGRVIHADGSNDCLLDVPQWSFNWQGGYTLAQPEVVNPGDQLYLECRWNNTAANQPIINGQQVAPKDLNWGETTEDEMCLEILYLTQ